VSSTRFGLYAVTKQLASLKFGSGYILLRPPIDQGLVRKALFEQWVCYFGEIALSGISATRCGVLVSERGFR
jgi:hypothetical protein